MAVEISDKLRELVEYCMKNDIIVEFFNHGENGDVFEDTTIDGKRHIRIEVGDADTQQYQERLNEFVYTIIGSPSIPLY